MKDLNFEFYPGSRIGIIGKSGSGKTTLLNTLLGFYNYTGDLKIQDQELKQLHLKSWRQHTAWLTQNPIIYQGTLFDNVTLGRSIPVDQVKMALKKAYAEELMTRLPSGLNTVLSEYGNSLSVGQAQRIALARALVKLPKWLFLDEPTASVDEVSAHYILQSINELPQSVGMVSVTHRLDKIHDFDWVIVLDQGRLITQGKPSDVVHTEPFKKLLELL